MNIRHIELVDKKYNNAMFSFKCEKEYFENYLTMQAYYDYINGLATTHLFVEDIDENQNILLGFYALRNSSLVFNDIDDGVRIGLPSIEIFQFATNKAYQRQGIGKIMMQDIISLADDMNKFSSASNLVLCSTKEAFEFYHKMGFDEIDNKEKFIPRDYCNKNCIPMARNIRIVQAS